MKSARAAALGSILKGVLISAAATLVGMLLLAAAVVWLDISDGALSALNQVLKLVSILLGVRFAVGVGGERGFLTGAAVGLVYMILGYVLYWQLGGAVFSFAAMLLEMLLGGAMGAVTGAVCANLRPRARRRGRTARKV
ncbi:MAG TPA: TIGR04086 family membrane protein [Candidatus Pullichristensenella stercorigallinarum]|uniref:TIGR04086 family membrane protein n=1 Tax=Candidatus Pullichristensenella stercorigallinarum TaxID=2840909 RepID=A0A9D0ZLD6_9FIRM|nr:TIGR04086 family membrane protein [Candidatus Pullichristensenella stercorigallinarum]